MAVALILRALGLGDVLTGLPAIWAVRRQWPSHHLVLAAPAALGALVRQAGAVDGVLPVDGVRALPAPPAGLAADVAINLHGRGPQSHRWLLSTHAADLVAYRCEQAGFHGPIWDPDEHEVLRWCRLVRSAGAAPELVDLLLPPSALPSPAPGAVVLHPGAASAARRWPAARFADVGAALAASGRRIVVTGGPGEADLAREVARGCDGEAIVGAPLDLLVALLQDAALVICGDTGVGHLATACRTPSVHLFGPEPPARWRPLLDPDRHVVLWRGADRTPGDPHGAELDPALALITVRDVLAAAHGLLTCAPPRNQRL